MPYSKVHWFMLALLGVTVVAFWPSYFGRLQEASLAHHLHGITGTLWILLIAMQGFLVSKRKLSLHRAMGTMVFVAAPLLIGAFSMASWAAARKAVERDPFSEMFGRALLTGDVLLIVFTALLVYLALRYRRNVRLHGALMISTVLGLLPPIFARLFGNHLPGFVIEGPDTLHRFGDSLLLSVILTVALGLYLAWRYRPHGWPWLLAAGANALLYLLYASFGRTGLWTEWVHGIASLSPATAFGFGLVLGGLACALGWRHGKMGPKLGPGTLTTEAHG